LALPAFGREDYTRNFDKTVTMQAAQRLRVEHKFGDIVVHTHANPELVIHAVIRTSASDAKEARRYAESVRITVEPAGSDMLIETVYPKQEAGGWFGRNVSYSVNFEILMPDSSPLALRNSFGAVSVNDLKASSEIATSHGRLEFRNGRGNQRLENSFAPISVSGIAGELDLSDTNGDIDIADVTGGIDVRDRFGKVTVSRTGGGKIVDGNGAVRANTISGPLNITTSFAPVNANDIKGNLIVHNQNGDIEAIAVKGAAELLTGFALVHFENVAGPVTVHAGNSGIRGHNVQGSAILQNSFAPVDVSEIRKDASVTSQNGNVSLADVGEGVTVKTSFGLVKAERVGGALRVENQNGGVNASSIKGGVNVKTSFSGVNLDAVGGSVEVENQNGSVQVNSTRGKVCEPISIRTSFAPVQVRIPSDGGYTVSAKTSFGNIHSDLPMLVSGLLTQDSVNGKIGSGACPMNLINQNGNIDILK
jgi:DUF4097 and DUF4098 domain-containing protein YvlB